VAINGRDHQTVAEVVSGLDGSVPVAGDVSTPEGAYAVVDETVEALGSLDVLVCNVGGGGSVPPGEETFEEWQRVFALNLWSTTNTVHAARMALRASVGSIVCISSICGLETVRGAPVTYSAAKSALHAYVRGIAWPLGEDGVRINAIAVGNMLFDGSVWSKQLALEGDEVASMLKTQVALGRFGVPNDVANLVAFLASDRSGFATGAVWALDGGQVHS
jgi:NAD(P)-dependent dehydrogenase (short-subunit alcohol dehydrogenase family)